MPSDRDIQQLAVRARRRRSRGGPQLYVVGSEPGTPEQTPDPAVSFSLQTRVVCLRITQERGIEILVTGPQGRPELPSGAIADGRTPEQSAAVALDPLGVEVGECDQVITRVVYDPQPHAVVGVLVFPLSVPDTLRGRWLSQVDAFQQLPLLDAEIVDTAFLALCPDDESDESDQQLEA